MVGKLNWDFFSQIQKEYRRFHESLFAVVRIGDGHEPRHELLPENSPFCGLWGRVIQLCSPILAWGCVWCWALPLSHPTICPSAQADSLAAQFLSWGPTLHLSGFYEPLGSVREESGVFRTQRHHLSCSSQAGKFSHWVPLLRICPLAKLLTSVCHEVWSGGQGCLSWGGQPMWLAALILWLLSIKLEGK